MASKRFKIGDDVQILGGLPEFINKTGTIVDVERMGGTWGSYYRVAFDPPIEVKGAGIVRDDLWQAELLKKI